ncbi:MAG: virulence RhuM family protein [Ignavibacteriaceae bacterium]|nr:virulence RhuM family protein [Ignavibacteriaceae bacterium]MCW8817949.1 virulence RhuM family protein [Ignavibacteriaceae bacterium]
MKSKSKGEILLYKTPEGDTQIDVKLEEKTVWLNLNQLAALLQKDKSVISRHIRNIFNEKELQRNSTVAKFATVQVEGNRKIEREIEYYNLDVTMSVGYRVKSKRGTQFRIWANKVLKDYLTKGYVLNERRLKEQTERIKELEKTLDIFSKVTESYQLKQDEFAGIIQVVKDYTYALDTLDNYDKKSLSISSTNKKEIFQINYESSKKVITKMKEKFGGSTLFGKEKDKSFKGTVGTIYQTFGKKELYPSIEEKAAHLLYFTIKNHSFIDGNKRIAAALFLWFLQMNNYLYAKNGSKRIPDNALVALCLLIAESNPKEKDMIVKVVINLINKKN